STFYSIPELLTDVDPIGIAQQLHFKSNPDEYTLIKNVGMVNVDTLYSCEGGCLARKRLARLEFLPVDEEPFQQRVDHFHHLLQKSVSGYLESNPSILVSLSGGFDSRILMAEFRRQNVSSLSAATMGNSNWHEVNIAAKVAETLGTPHHVYERVLDCTIEECRQYLFAYNRLGAESGL